MPSRSPTRPASADKPARAAPKRRPRGRPSHADAVRFREDVLGIALEVFLEQGYAGASMDGIARRAKVSKNTVYLQYKTKNELFRTAALHGLVRVRSELDTSIHGDQPLQSVLLSIVRQVQTLAADPGLRGLARLLIAESQRFPDIAAAMLDEVAHLFEPVTVYLRQAVRDGLLRVPDPAAATLDLAILAMGGFNFLLSEPPTSAAVLRKRAGSVVALLLDGWRP
ncbi:TetR/AcrR family transcriptional regulator [Hydrocarboniphaga sp.]|uniref:TetR/AcrR family transcriptional regulator n=1 Tax=Hydrocarboniphaga sp. TaxID=2033016 RepID=UPI00261DDAA6|nr:TetR/AcrR family transcriptional regulator [Hydrocarboniphaga sp.]